METLPMKLPLLIATMMIGCAATLPPKTIFDEPVDLEVIEVESYYTLIPTLDELRAVVVFYTYTGAAYSYEMNDLVSLSYENKLLVFSVIDNHIYDITDARKLKEEDFYLLNRNPYTHAAIMDGILAMNVEPKKEGDDGDDGPDFIYMCGEGVPTEQCGFAVDPEEPEFIKSIRNAPSGATTPIGEGFKPSKGGYDMRMDRVLNPHDDGMVDRRNPGQPLADLAH